MIRFKIAGDLKSPSDDRDGRSYQGWATSHACDQRALCALLRQGYEGFFCLSSALVPEKFNLEAWTKPEALTLADFDQPRGAGGECFHIGAFGHEEHLVEGDRREV